MENRANNIAYGIMLYDTLDGTENRDIVEDYIRTLTFGEPQDAFPDYDSKVLQYLFDNIDQSKLSNNPIYDNILGVLTNWLVEELSTAQAKEQILNTLYMSYKFPC